MVFKKIISFFCRGQNSGEPQLKSIYFQQLFARSPEAIVISDEKNMIKNVNRAFTELFGYNRQEVIGRDIDRLIVPREKTYECQRINRRLAEGEVVRLETVRKKKNGHKIYVDFLGYSIELGNKKVGYYGIYRDISQRKNLEERLRDNKKKIEQLHEVALKMDSCQNKEEVYRLTVDAGERILDFDVCTLDIVEDGEFVVKATSTGVGENDSIPMSIEEGICGKAYREGQSHLTSNINGESEANPAKNNYRSALTVPIGDYGIFQVISTEVDYFDKEDLKMTELLISHTLSALERLSAEEVIDYLGFHDKLTGLYNRAFVEEEMERLDAKRQLPLSIIMGDVNGLKLVNDALGHKEGDKLLTRAAEIIRNSCRNEDIIGRWGGDEFLVLLPRTSAEDADKIAARINNHCLEARKEIPVSIALGRATKYNIDQPLIEVLNHADDKMYEDKRIESEESRNKIITMLLERLDYKNNRLREQCRRMKDKARKLGGYLVMSHREIEQLLLAINIHEIGLISVREDILQKDITELDKQERNILQTHPETGYRIARATDKYAGVAEAILYHHEKWDGSGYPDGLKGENIPLNARIISMLDFYDCLRNQNNLSREEAIRGLKKEAGKSFDPHLVDIFVNRVIH